MKSNRAKVTFPIADKPMVQRVADSAAKAGCARICVVVGYQKESVIACLEGVMPGSIATSARGENGFGYDSIFIPEHGALRYAELDDRQKNAISHRARALQKALPLLKDILELQPQEV